MIQSLIAYTMTTFFGTIGLVGVYNLAARKVQQGDIVYYIAVVTIFLTGALLAAKQGGI